MKKTLLLVALFPSIMACVEAGVPTIAPEVSVKEPHENISVLPVTPSDVPPKKPSSLGAFIAVGLGGITLVGGSAVGAVLWNQHKQQQAEAARLEQERLEQERLAQEAAAREEAQLRAFRESLLLPEALLAQDNLIDILLEALNGEEAKVRLEAFKQSYIKYYKKAFAIVKNPSDDYKKMVSFVIGPEEAPAVLDIGHNYGTKLANFASYFIAQNEEEQKNILNYVLTQIKTPESKPKNFKNAPLNLDKFQTLQLFLMAIYLAKHS